MRIILYLSAVLILFSHGTELFAQDSTSNYRLVFDESHVSILNFYNQPTYRYYFSDPRMTDLLFTPVLPFIDDKIDRIRRSSTLYKDIIKKNREAWLWYNYEIQNRKWKPMAGHFMDGKYYRETKDGREYRLTDFGPMQARPPAIYRRR